jgi:organic hydroperoxide reductase OsmC/OhrA
MWLWRYLQCGKPLEPADAYCARVHEGDLVCPQATGVERIARALPRRSIALCGRAAGPLTQSFVVRRRRSGVTIMEISAHLRNCLHEHEVRASTGDVTQALPLPAKATGTGSATNGGELLMAALATCYCNDLYREAARLGIEITGCEVVARAQFDGIGRAAEAVSYSARVESSASPEQVELLLAETDRLAEVHNTLRAGCTVQRIPWGDACAG